MIKKLLDVYKIYFLISLVVFVLVFLANYEKVNIFLFIPAFFATLLVPFLYELDYIFQAYIIEPESAFSTTIKNLVTQKNYRGVFIYAHENEGVILNSVLRSVITVLGIFAIAFLSIFTFSNVVSQSILLSFLLTSIYLQTISFVNGSYRSWYSFLDFIPKASAAKAFLVTQYLVFIFFLLSIF